MNELGCAKSASRYLRGKGKGESEKVGLGIIGVELGEGEAQSAHSGLTVGSSHPTFPRTIGKGTHCRLLL